MNENHLRRLDRAARLGATLAVALALAGCGSRAPATVEPSPTVKPIVMTAMPTPAPTATPDTATALESAPGTIFESPPGTTLDSPLGTTLDSPIALPAPGTGTQVPTAVEEQIAAAMLETIVTQDLGGTVASAGEVAAADVGPEDALIVWTNASPAVATGEDQSPRDRLPKLDEGAPIRVWVHRDGGQATVSGDAAARAEAIRAYRAATIEADATQDIVTWGLYAFGIVALDEEAGQATVYREASCGRLCASGTLYTLGRGPDGAWSVIESSTLWMA